MLINNIKFGETFTFFGDDFILIDKSTPNYKVIKKDDGNIYWIVRSNKSKYCLIPSFEANGLDKLAPYLNN